MASIGSRFRRYQKRLSRPPLPHRTLRRPFRIEKRQLSVFFFVVLDQRKWWRWWLFPFRFLFHAHGGHEETALGIQQRRRFTRSQAERHEAHHVSAQGTGGTGVQRRTAVAPMQHTQRNSVQSSAKTNPGFSRSNVPIRSSKNSYSQRIL